MTYYLECQVCGGEAFRFKARPIPGQVVRADDVLFPDGSSPVSGDLMRCGTCSANVGTAHLRDKNLRERIQ